MANVKITELTAATALAGTDVLPIVDVGADATKKVSVSDLLRNLPDGSAASPSLAFADDQNTGVLSPGDNSLAFATSGTQRLVIDSSGKIGVGTASPGAGLDVVGNSTMLRLYDGTNTSTGKISQSSDVITLSQAGTSSGALAFATGSGALGTERMRIDGSGNVGIGDTSPSNELVVKSGGSPTIEINGQGRAASLTLGVTASESKLFEGSNNALAFGTNNTERLRIDNSGKVGIGTNSPANILHLSSTGTPTIQITDEDNSGIVKIENGSGSLFLNADTGNTVSNSRIQFGIDGSERLRIDSSGRVGIGTSSPTNVRLDIKEPVSSTAGTGHLGFSGGSTPLWVWRLSDSAADLYLDRYSGGWSATPSLTIKRDTGNVGIGTTSPSTSLDVSGAISLGSVAIPSAGTARIYSRNTDNNLYLQTGSGDTINFLDGSQNTLASFGDTALVFNTGNTERMRIDNLGNVAIGTTSIDRQFHVQGGGVSGTQVQIEGTTDSAGIKFVPASSGDHYEIQATNSSALIFYNRTDSTERMRIDGAGKVGIGTTSPQAPFVISNSGAQGIEAGYSSGTSTNFIQAYNRSSSAFIQFDVIGNPLVFKTGSSATERMRIASSGLTDAFSTTSMMRLRTGLTGTNGQILGGFNGATSTSNGTQSLAIYANGNIQNTNNSYGSLSDAKLKENVVNANSQWNDIKNIRVRNYNFIEGETHTQLGVVAQEVETVSPGLVTDLPDLDEEGNDLGTVTKSVNYSVLYMKAVKALQEAMDRIETLEAKVAALEAQ